MVCANWLTALATATTNVRSNSSSSWLATRFGSSIARANIRTRMVRWKVMQRKTRQVVQP